MWKPNFISSIIEANIWAYICDFGIGKDFLNKTFKMEKHESINPSNPIKNRQMCVCVCVDIKTEAKSWIRINVKEMFNLNSVQIFKTKL